MKNSKIIVVNGIQRGGTNVVWNMLQSHPQVCAPKQETGRLLHKGRLSDLMWRYMLIRNATNPLIARPLSRWADQRLFNNKMRILSHEDDRYKYEDVVYTEEEVRNNALCIKSVNEDIGLTDFFSRVYDDSYFVGVVRNGYAVCDSWIRRGRSAQKAGYYYSTYVAKMINDSQRCKHYKMIKFEDALSMPFLIASQLYEFAHLTPTKLDKLRLESKKVFQANGEHQAKFGMLRRKYWFSEDTIFEMLDPNISRTQADNLSVKDKQKFEEQARSVLDYFNYS